jgi:predicted RNA-binding Zn ribbon-like protein
MLRESYQWKMQITAFLPITIMLAFTGYGSGLHIAARSRVGGLALTPSASRLELLGGRLAIDFVNATRANAELSWERLIQFLEATGIISAERGAQLVALPDSDLQAAEGLLLKSQRLGSALRKAFAALLRKQKIAVEWVEPINEILRITEGHDELVSHAGGWRIEFIAREGGLDWLLAAVARSGAEIVAEGPQASLRLCANPHCGLFFCDTSRTHRRRWCSMAVCGNRSKVAAFARKHASPRHANP